MFCGFGAWKLDLNSSSEFDCVGFDEVFNVSLYTPVSQGL